MADEVAQCWAETVGSYPSPCPSPRKGEGTLELLPHPLADADRGTLAARATPSPLAGEGWGEGEFKGTTPYVVCTGGEPLLQLDEPLIEALHARGFEIAIETNGTLVRAARHRLDLREPQGATRRSS